MEPRSDHRNEPFGRHGSNVWRNYALGSSTHDDRSSFSLRTLAKRMERPRVPRHQRLGPFCLDEQKLSTLRNHEVDLQTLLVAKVIELATATGVRLALGDLGGEKRLEHTPHEG